MTVEMMMVASRSVILVFGQDVRAELVNNNGYRTCTRNKPPIRGPISAGGAGAPQGGGHERACALAILRWPPPGGLPQRPKVLSSGGSGVSEQAFRLRSFVRARASPGTGLRATAARFY